MVDEVVLDSDGNPVVSDTTNIDFDRIIAENQDETNALKKENDELRNTNNSLKREIEKHKNDAEREHKKGKTALDEKKAMLEKVKHYQSMFEGLDEETAKEVLQRARDGEGNDFEEQKAQFMESAVSEFKEVHYNPLLDEVQELKDKNELFKQKLHESVIKSEIVNNLVKFGVDPSLASYAASDFEGRMKINEKGERVYLNKDGHPTNSFDWKSHVLVLKNEKPALFRKSNGSNANTSVDVSSIEIGNPWLKGTPSYSRTQQLKIMGEDPAKAERLKREARGKKAA